MWLESEPGKGSHFHFTAPFPVHPSTEAADVVPEAARGAATLVVVTQALTRRTLAQMLRECGLQVHTAETASEAWHLLRTLAQEGAPLRLVFIDTVLRDESGFHLAERILRDPALGPPHIVLLSLSTRVGDAARAIALGLPPPLIQPLRYEEVRRTVAAAFAPRFATAHRSESLAVAPSHPPRPRRILLAEDNTMNQQLVRRLLEPRGYEVVVVENGAEAVAAVQKEPFDLILMDLQMPVMDGIAAAQTIRNLESSRTARTPILALTAHALPEDQERCLAAGMDGYISKPIQARQLIDTVEAFLASSSSEPPPSSSPPEGPAPGGLAGSGPSLGSTPAFGSRHFAPLPN